MQVPAISAWPMFHASASLCIKVRKLPLNPQHMFGDFQVSCDHLDFPHTCEMYTFDISLL